MVLLLVLPNSRDVALSARVAREVAEKLAQEGKIRELMCVEAVPSDHDACAVIVGDAKGIGLEARSVSLDELIDVVAPYSEVYLLPMGIKSVIASVAYLLGKNGTPTYLVSAVSHRIKVRSIRTLRIVSTM